MEFRLLVRVEDMGIALVREIKDLGLMRGDVKSGIDVKHFAQIIDMQFETRSVKRARDMANNLLERLKQGKNIVAISLKLTRIVGARKRNGKRVDGYVQIVLSELFPPVAKGTKSGGAE